MRSYYKTVFWTVCPTVSLAHLAYEFAKGLVLCCLEGLFDGRLCVAFRVFYYLLCSALLQLCIIGLDLLNQLQSSFHRQLVQVFLITVSFLDSVLILRLLYSFREILPKSQKWRQRVPIIRRVEGAESDVITSYISGKLCLKYLILSACPALKLIFYHTVIVKILLGVFFVLVCVIFVSSHRVVVVDEVMCWNFDGQSIDRAERVWLESW